MMEVTSCGELERQTPEGEAGHPLGDLCAKLRHWPKPGSQGEQVKPTWLHSSSQNIATTMCFGEWLDCGLCVVQHHVRQRSVREKPSPSWHTHTHIPHIYIHEHTLTLKHIHVHLRTAHTHTNIYVLYHNDTHAHRVLSTPFQRIFSLHPIYTHAYTHANTHAHTHTNTIGLWGEVQIRGCPEPHEWATQSGCHNGTSSGVQPTCDFKCRW